MSRNKNLIRIGPEILPEKVEHLPRAQYNLFTGEAEPIPVLMDRDPDDEIVVDEGITLLKNGDASQILLSGFALFLSKKSERLLVKKSKKIIYEFPFFRLNEVIIASRGISLSSDLIEALCERGIRVNFLTGGGRPYAMLSSPMLTATVISRREQIFAYCDRHGLEFSKKVVTGKIKNQERLLRYFGKYIKAVDPDRFALLSRIVDRLKSLAASAKDIKGASVDEARDRLMGLEGTAGRLYWKGVGEIISHKMDFFGRETRGAADAVNSMLNYGYGILYSHVWGAVVNAGLEPFAGFLHVDRPGKPSLVLDLTEEFRQPVVDRVVIAHINLGEGAALNNGFLDGETRKIIGRKVMERLSSEERFKGKKYQIRSIIQMQARNLSAFLKGERDYKPFSLKW